VDKACRGVVTRDGWKYACFENMSWLLFKLNEGSYGQVNLAHNNACRAERKRLLERVKQWAAVSCFRQIGAGFC
jgi:hypothetical protein